MATYDLQFQGNCGRLFMEDAGLCARQVAGASFRVPYQAGTSAERASPGPPLAEQCCDFVKCAAVSCKAGTVTDPRQLDKLVGLQNGQATCCTATGITRSDVVKCA